MPTAARTFRVFVSSTFEDLKAERDALQRDVFPRLRKLCEANNARFQAIDLRWGVRDEAALDQQTMEICLREIARCQQTGIKPNFIVLLGERYGWLPLPARIEAGEFIEVRDRAAEDDKLLIDEWYERDDNAVPPEFLLKPRTGEFTDKDSWGEIEQRLYRILREAAQAAGLAPDALIRYKASATHQEILKGLGQSEEERRHVFAFFREPAEGATVDPELESLKDELRQKLPVENIRTFSASRIERLCADVSRQLRKVILTETGRFTSRPALDLEIKAHEDFALDRVRHFTGRQSVLDAIGEHIRSGENRPLVVHGASGCGKSAIMAKAAALAKNAAPRAVLIQRFIGVTPDASGGLSLLSSLCQQISRAYNVSEETPIGFQPLVAAFHERIARATAEKPLVIFLDALDQLRSDDEARSFTWLHQYLPPHVSFIVSTTEIPAGLTNAAQVLVEDFPPNEAEQVLTAWLTDAKRKLQTEQRQRVLSGFVQSGLPLYLKLAFEEARRWRSFDAAESCALGSDVSSMIDVLFARLSGQANHGPILVNRSLGYLAAARYGLTEDEMLEVLASDPKVWEDFESRAHHQPPSRQLPVIVWSRLFLDIEAYLNERAAPGGTVIAFYHRQLAERVEAKFLAGDEAQKRHSDLARYFLAKPAWLDEGQKTPSARRAAELVYQQRSARQWAEAEATLFDCPFLFAKVAADMVLDLDDDYLTLLRDAPQSELQDHDTLRLLQGTLRLSLHIVAKDSGQFASQMRGRLLAHQAKPGIAAFLKDLDACTPRPRLWPLWPTLNAAGGPMLRVFEGHTDDVTAVALSGDGKRAVSGSQDGTLRVWDLEGNQPPRILEGHMGYVTAVALSADGKCVASGSDDHTVRVWDLERNQPPRILEGHKYRVTAVALSADGKRVVSGSRDMTLRIWDLEGNQPPCILEGHTWYVIAVTQSADSWRAVSGSVGNTLQVWDLEGNQQSRILKDLEWPVCDDLALSGDGMHTLFSVGNTLQVWDLEGNQPPRILEGHKGSVSTVALSGDGKRAVCGSVGNTLQVWDLDGNQPPHVLRGHTKGVNAVAVSADGKRAVSGSGDYTVRVWDLEGNQPPRILEGHTDPVMAVVLSADGQRAVSGSGDNTLRVWDLKVNDPPRILEGIASEVLAMALSSDGQRAISSSSDNAVRVWDLEGNQSPRLLEGHTGVVWAVALSEDGQRAVTGSLDITIRVWDLEGNQPSRVLEGHTDRVSSVALSGDGKCAVSGSCDHTVRVWDLESNQPPRLLEGHTNVVNAVALSGNGQRAISGSWDHTLRVWDLETGRCLAVFICDASVYSCAWARERARIVAGDGLGNVHLFAWEE